jgi:hypothetical protein
MLARSLVTCFFCNEIEIDMANLLDDAYELDWMNVNLRQRKDLILLREQLKCPQRMIGLGVFVINLDAFLKIMQWIYSLYCFLNHVQK